MLVENFLKFIKYYGKGRKLKLAGFSFLSLIAGFIELLGIALIWPFTIFIIQPKSIMESKYYIDFAFLPAPQSQILNICILGLLAMFLFVAKNFIMILILYLQNKFVNNWKLDIGKKMMHNYLFSSYKETLKETPSEKMYNLNFMVNQVLDGFIFRIINLITNMIIVFLILAFLFTKFLFAGVVVSVFVFYAMSFQNRFFKKKMSEIGKAFLKSSSQNNDRIIENINNIKEIKINFAEEYFYQEYVKTQTKFVGHVFESNFYGMIPPYVIEIFVVLSLFILAGIISFQNIENTSLMIASYAILVASIFRMAPSLNKIQIALNSVNSSRDFVKSMILEHEKYDFDEIEEKTNLRISLREKIQLKNISFAYKTDLVIKNLDLEIKKGEFIGIVGASGVGKTTLADIIMGLLPVNSGEIYVDDIKLNQSNYSVLRNLIGYVPQQMNILEGPVKNNVAWGVSEEEINEQKVIEALKKAQLYNHVMTLDAGINSRITNTLSGFSQGEKQRLAIARVLYRDPEILIFDEATSSLDVKIEHEITEMLKCIKGEKTMIAIAHRLSTLKNCDRLIYLKDGNICDTGTFEELSKKNADFAKMLKLSKIEI